MANKNQTVETPGTETGEAVTLDNATGEVVTETATGEVVEAATDADAPVSTVTDGTRARRAIMLKQFIPNPDWINKNIVAHGKGTRATLGRIFGICTGTTEKFNTLPDGSTSRSIVCTGIFKSEDYQTGEEGEATTVYFPMAYAERINAVFKSGSGVKVVEVDCDIGLEATGKTIPYEWVVVAYREGAEMEPLKRIASGRGRPKDAPPLLSKPAPQLTASA